MTRDGLPESPASAVTDAAAPTGADGQDELREKLGAAARNSAIGQAATQDVSWQSVLAALGGWFGVVEAIVPGLAFVLIYRFTDNLPLSIVVPAGLGVLTLVVRLVMRQPMGGAFSGLFGILLSGLIALNTGEGVDYFAMGLWINAVAAAGLLLSMLLGWPLVGIVLGLISPELDNWRSSRRLRLWMHGLTAIWVAVFLIRLTVQVPLYQAGNTEALGTARIAMGVPLFAVAFVVTSLLARTCIRQAVVERSEASEPIASKSSVE